jgi:SEL1 protein
VADAQRIKGSSGVIENIRLTTDNPRGQVKRGADDDVLQYYEQSANKGSVDAQLTLGHLHYHGARGLPADIDKAFAYYSKAAASGEVRAFSHMGNMYAQGVGVEQNNETALQYFRRGAAKDHAPSQNGLGYMYMHGHGVTRDYKKALEYFKAAAERGNPEAQFNLGAMYIGGMGVRKAYDKALHYFTLSAHQGHTLALYNLGQMHLNGLGTPRSCPVGAQFLKAVAERGPWSSVLEDAHAALQDGSGDEAGAMLLYAPLAEGGFELAQANVAFLLDQQFTQQVSVPLLGMRGAVVAERALYMYKHAASQGNLEAEVKLGDYAYYGLGIEVDLEAAVAHYRTAADTRSAQATFNLAYMYAHGLGLSRDYHLAKRHYDIAAEIATEAWAPVHLALLELKLLEWWEANTGGSYGNPYEYVASLLEPLVSAASAALGPLAELESDTLLIMGLCAALGIVILVRQRQQLAT